MPTKKIKTPKHFSLDSDPFKITDHSLKVVIRGRPLVWKRVGWGRNGAYTPSKKMQNEFCDVVKTLFILKGAPIVNFGDAELELSIEFCLPTPVRSGAITSPPDLDNLLKFVFDSFQGNFYSNDSAITKMRDVEKKFGSGYGGNGYTVVYLAKRIIEIDC
jgi:Holliday junction resolvase RusA-like endonuclease